MLAQAAISGHGTTRSSYGRRSPPGPAASPLGPRPRIRGRHGRTGKEAARLASALAAVVRSPLDHRQGAIPSLTPLGLVLPARPSTGASILTRLSPAPTGRTRSPAAH